MTFHGQKFPNNLKNTIYKGRGVTPRGKVLGGGAGFHPPGGQLRSAPIQNNLKFLNTFKCIDGISDLHKLFL